MSDGILENITVPGWTPEQDEERFLRECERRAMQTIETMLAETGNDEHLASTWLRRILGRMD